jgi:hypothetical protein
MRNLTIALIQHYNPFPENSPDTAQILSRAERKLIIL